MLTTTFTALVFAAVVSATTTHHIIVGGPDTLAFTPPYVSAHVGDIVRFEFHEKNHTATQSAFLTPCSPLAGGFNSGFQPVSEDLARWQDFPYKEFHVTNTAPTWFYCQQSTHCSKNGMVFAVNPGVAPATNTFDAFKAIAQGGKPPAPPSTNDGWQSDPDDYPGDYPSDYPTYDPPYQPKTHTIVVGGSAGLVYTPSNITANVGDIITFQFKQKNHTVTQSSFNDPCRKLEFTSNEVGFDSGFNFFVADGATYFPTYSIHVKDTKPIWAYCRQTAPVSHCGSGMVFSANAVESGPNNFAAFQAKARASNGAPQTPAPYAASAQGGAGKKTGGDIAAPQALAADASGSTVDPVVLSDLHDYTDKLVKYVPYALGLLAGSTLLLLILLIVSIVSCTRRGKGRTYQPISH